MSHDQAQRRPNRILGVTFFEGNAKDAVERMRDGGLLVAPPAPGMKDMATHGDYRKALLEADVVIPDSGLMVLVWNLTSRHRLRKLSGLEYLRELLRQPEFRDPGSTLWVMASPVSLERNRQWLRDQGIEVPPDDVYQAPVYGDDVADEALLKQANARRYKHIIITIGGGTQERLGLYLRQNLDYRPAIHCIGAAIAFLSGDQVHIPPWADRLYLGWLFRCISDPRRFVPRYWVARKLLPLMLRYRRELPPLKTEPPRP